MAISISLIILYLAISSFGLYKMKVAMAGAGTLLSGEFILGFGAYVFGFLLWLLILARLPLSVAFPVAAGGLIVSTQLMGVGLLKEPMPPLHIVGVVLIFFGIVLIYAKAP